MYTFPVGIIPGNHTIFFCRFSETKPKLSYVSSLRKLASFYLGYKFRIQHNNSLFLLIMVDKGHFLERLFWISIDVCYWVQVSMDPSLACFCTYGFLRYTSSTTPSLEAQHGRQSHYPHAFFR